MTSIADRIRSLVDALAPPATVDDASVGGGRHVPALDAVRGLAILAVTLYRFRGDEPSGDPASSLWFKLLGAGTKGVDLFFVLSGFLITGLLIDLKGRPRYFVNFFARRSLRIFPLYFGLLAAVFLLWPKVGGRPEETFPEATPLQAWLWTYGTNLFVAWKEEWCFGPFNHAWSLAVEEHFYLAWPLVVWATPDRWLGRLSLAVAIASAAARIGYVASTGNEIAGESFTLFRLDSLAIGAFLATVARRPEGLLPWRRASLGLASALFIGLTIAFLTRRTFASAADTAVALYEGCMLVMALTTAPDTASGAFWKNPALRWLGKHSYAMYLFQAPLIPLVAPWFSIAGLEATVGVGLPARVVYCGGMFALTALLAWISWHAYERHWLRLKDRFV